MSFNTAAKISFLEEYSDEQVVEVVVPLNFSSDSMKFLGKILDGLFGDT
ncbi:MAG: hypothetical protein WA323_01470 [Candidatus Nitrosopolaris sp.]|jgi:hypothetical protein